MNVNDFQIGPLGESIAAQYLKNRGYNIQSQNYRSRFGEIDIIAKKNNNIVFAEVKCRVGNRMGNPYEAVNRKKIKKITDTAALYMLKNGLKGYKLSVHVISIVLNPDKTVKEIKHFEDVLL